MADTGRFDSANGGAVPRRVADDATVQAHAGARARRRARGAVIALAVIAFGLALWNARGQFFVWDEWEYWEQRHWLAEARAFGEFFLRPHGPHLVALTMALWWPLDALFGLHTYVPYVVPTILAHCVAGLLLFELLCAARLRPAVAAVTAAVYLFLASASPSWRSR